MTIPGFLIMVISVGTVTVVFGWCVLRVLRDPPDDDDAVQ